MVGDGSSLTVREVAERLTAFSGTFYSQARVRQLADAGYMRVVRRLSAGPGYAHRRIDTASVGELEQVLQVPAGVQRDAAMAELRRRNLGLDESGPTPEGEQGQNNGE